MLRKQWVEHERLTFPLMTLPLAMSTREPQGFFPVGILNLPIFWLGFAFAIFPILWNMIGYFVPVFPTIPRQFGHLSLGREFPPIQTRFYPLIIGVSYFIELEISFSIIIYFLLLTLETGILTRLGFELGPPRGDTSQFENWQGLGALCVLIPWGLWMARGHLYEVYRKAIHRDPSIDDSGEMLSYRTALYTWILSGLFILAWCVASGMTLYFATVFLFFVLIVWLGISRISIETGLISSRTIHAQFATVHVVDLANATPSSLVALAMTRTWHRDLKTALMAPMANSVRLFDEVRSDRTRLTIAVAIAVAVVAGGSAYYAISAGYSTGAYNYGGIYAGSVQGTFDRAVGYIKDPFGLDRELALWSLLGVATAVANMAIRYAHPSFPLHPIGFVSATTYPANQSIFSLFIAWFAKQAILRFGGIGLYRRAAPFFMGLMLGYFTGVGISFIVDCIWFPGEGHHLSLY